MSLEEQIKDHFASQLESKGRNMQTLHHNILEIIPEYSSFHRCDVLVRLVGGSFGFF